MFHLPRRVSQRQAKCLTETLLLLLFVCFGCLTSQQQASVSRGRICSYKCTCCHTEKEVADQTFYLTQARYTDTRPTSPGTDPMTPGAQQGSHWCARFLSHLNDSTRKKNHGASGNRTPDPPLSRCCPISTHRVL